MEAHKAGAYEAKPGRNWTEKSKLAMATRWMLATAVQGSPERMQIRRINLTLAPKWIPVQQPDISLMCKADPFKEARSGDASANVSKPAKASVINARCEKIQIRHNKISLTPSQMACSFDEKNLVREERSTRSLQRQIYEQHNGTRGNSLSKKPMAFTYGTDFPDVQCSFDEKHLVREERSTRSSQTITNKLYLKRQIYEQHNDTRGNSLSKKPLAFTSGTDFPDVQCSSDEKHLVREERSTRSSQTITNKLYLKRQICEQHNDTRGNSLSKKPMAFTSGTDLPDVQCSSDEKDLVREERSTRSFQTITNKLDLRMQIYEQPNYIRGNSLSKKPVTFTYGTDFSDVQCSFDEKDLVKEERSTRSFQTITNKLDLKRRINEQHNYTKGNSLSKKPMAFTYGTDFPDVQCSFDEKHLVREERSTRSSQTITNKLYLKRQICEQHNDTRGNSLSKKPMAFTSGTDFSDVQSSFDEKDLVREERSTRSFQTITNKLDLTRQIYEQHNYIRGNSFLKKPVAFTYGTDFSDVQCSFDEKHLVREERSTRSSQTITNKLYLKRQICEQHNDPRGNSLSKKPMAFTSGTDFPDVLISNEGTFLARKQDATNPILQKSFSLYFELIRLKSQPVDDITDKKLEAEPSMSVEGTGVQAAQCSHDLNTLLREQKTTRSSQTTTNNLELFRQNYDSSNYTRKNMYSKEPVVHTYGTDSSTVEISNEGTFLARKRKAANPVLKRSFSHYLEPVQLKSQPVDDITGKKLETEPTTSMEDSDSQAAQNNCVIPCRAETVQERTPRCFKLRSWFRNIRHIFYRR